MLRGSRDSSNRRVHWPARSWVCRSHVSASEGCLCLGFQGGRFETGDPAVFRTMRTFFRPECVGIVGRTQ